MNFAGSAWVVASMRGWERCGAYFCIPAAFGEEI
jgi:hypothetical protein